MKARRDSLAVVLVVALLLGTAWAQTQTKTVSGKVVTVTDEELTIEVKEGEKTKKMEFVLDEETKVEGELKAGVNVQVTYYTDEEDNVATRVVVVQ